jgi:hypothetical protein
LGAERVVDADVLQDPDSVGRESDVDAAFFHSGLPFVDCAGDAMQLLQVKS